MLVNLEGKLQARKINQAIFREMVAKCIIEHDLPFSYVEYDRVRLIWKYLNADVKFISRNTTAADVFKFYENEKAKLKVELSEIPGRIAFTSDLWFAITVEGYICLTAHYVDRHWKLRNKILSFISLPPPHTGIDLAIKILEVWKKWGIERKVFSLTLDNASNNDSMHNILKKQLLIQNDLLCGVEFFHIRYSTFKMLDRAIKYHLAFDSYQGIDPSYKFLPTRDEWDLGIQICELLQPFDEITNLISGSTYPTSNLYFMQVYKIEYWLRAHEAINGEGVIFDMVYAMKGKFDKYWHDYSEILAMTVVCDPRFKLSLLEFCFTNLDPSTSQQKVDNVKDKLNLLFKAYSKPTAQSSQSVESLQEAVAGVGDSQSHGKSAINYNDFNNFHKKNVTASGKSALDLYLDEPPIDMEMFASLNVLDYWKDNSHRFGELCRMACDLLSLPITTIASESSFSIGSRVLNKYRSYLLPRNVQSLICARNWLRGFEPYDNESDEVHGESDNLASVESSNS